MLLQFLLNYLSKSANRDFGMIFSLIINRTFQKNKYECIFPNTHRKAKLLVIKNSQTLLSNQFRSDIHVLVNFM